MTEARIRTLLAAAIVILWLGVLYLIFHPVSYSAAPAPIHATAYIECDTTGCQIDVEKPGYDIQEYWVQAIVYEEK